MTSRSGPCTRSSGIVGTESRVASAGVGGDEIVAYHVESWTCRQHGTCGHFSLVWIARPLTLGPCGLRLCRGETPSLSIVSSSCHPRRAGDGAGPCRNQLESALGLNTTAEYYFVHLQLLPTLTHIGPPFQPIRSRQYHLSTLAR